MSVPKEINAFGQTDDDDDVDADQHQHRHHPQQHPSSGGASTFSRRRGDYDDGGRLLDNDNDSLVYDDYNTEEDNDDEDTSSTVSDYYQRKQLQLRRAQRMAMANNTGGPTRRPVHQHQQSHHVPDHRIGLIETNLDTHETVISGKTQSLMELGPQMMMGRHAAGKAGPEHHHHQRASTGTGNGGASVHRMAAAIEPRRPHKSMEFLLDKENQKNVLVSSYGFLIYVFLCLYEIASYPFIYDKNLEFILNIYYFL